MPHRPTPPRTQAQARAIRPEATRRAGAIGLAVLAALGLMAAARNANAQAVVDEGGLRSFLSQQATATAVREGFTRFEVQLALPEAAATLPPCRRAEPFLPSTARPWGRTAVGLRCVDGATWTLMVPATVAVWGRAPVATATLAAGATVSAQDLQEQEVELTREPPGVARDTAALVGRTLTRAVAAGSPLRPDMTRAPTAVNAGDTVRLRVAGTGFAITAAGQALNPAAAGQPVRVRTELGRVLTGTAREGRLVEVTL